MFMFVQVNEELNGAYAALTASGECYISYSTDPSELLATGVFMMAKGMLLPHALF